MEWKLIRKSLSKNKSEFIYKINASFTFQIIIFEVKAGTLQEFALAWYADDELNNTNILRI